MSGSAPVRRGPGARLVVEPEPPAVGGLDTQAAGAGAASGCAADHPPGGSGGAAVEPAGSSGGAAVEPAGGSEGRRLRADAQRNRARVVEAATEAFAAEGIAVPIELIARRAGVGVGTIYRQFPSKESLYAAVVRHGLEQLLDRARVLASAEDAGEALFGFVHELLDAIAAKRDLVETLERAGEGVKSHLGPIHDEWQEAFGVLVERAQAAGMLRPDIAPDEVAALVGGTCGAVMHGELSRQARERLACVVCDGLRPGRAARAR